MASIWTIKGESGKEMDDTERDLAEVALNSRIAFRSLDADEFTYSVVLKGPAPTDEVIPENGQWVTLKRDGAQFFTGIASRSIAGHVVNVSVKGAWWWLSRIALTSAKTDSASTTSDRLTYGFSAQSLTTSLGAVVDRAIALGAPIQKGTLATTFSCPQITLNQSTCADAIAELVRLTPDLMAWFDYSTSPPTFNTSRRSSATVREIEAGQAPLQSWAVNPVIELKAEFVRLPYVARGTDGRRVWREQLSGDEGTAQSGTNNTIRLRSGASSLNNAYNGCSVTIVSGTGAGQTRTISSYAGSTRIATVSSNWSTNPNSTSVYRVGGGLPSNSASSHVLVVSGEELDTFLPNDLFESVTLQTIAPTTINTAMTNFIQGRDSGLSGRKYKYGSESDWVDPVVSSGANMVTYGGIYSSGSWSQTRTRAMKGITFTDPNNPATTISPTGKYLLVLGEVPSWLSGVAVTPAMMQCEVYYAWRATSQSGLDVDVAEWFVDAVNSAIAVVTGAEFLTVSNAWVRYAINLASFPVSLISAQYSTATTLYKDADYDFISPPSGFASGLQESQNFVPYEGTVILAEQDAGGTRYRGCVVNIDGTLPEMAAMKALVQTETLDLDQGRTILDLGAPERFNYRDFISRIRKTSQDNIVYL
jgi:hypothetical protein